MMGARLVIGGGIDEINERALVGGSGMFARFCHWSPLIVREDLFLYVFSIPKIFRLTQIAENSMLP